MAYHAIRSDSHGVELAVTPEAASEQTPELTRDESLASQLLGAWIDLRDDLDNGRVPNVVSLQTIGRVIRELDP